jgi:16S rRNA processing protein RimM
VNDAEDLVAIAKPTRARGLRGELVANILTDFPERFENLDRVFAVKPNGERAQLKLESFWFQKDRIVLKFAGVDSIERAEEFINAEICVLESEAVALEDDEFYDWQLQGCAVETTGGEPIGTVREIMRTGGTEILVVASAEDENKDFLIPFANEICIETDVENKLIRVDLPEGLLEF